ncbi:hypothetical protein QCA50_014072 [Cerrena zonata]|uniref:Transposase n=1 Tax=Cerrena zonata TaxID=2478898 RepID=A0AAW0FWX3_9APHY
MTTFGYMTARKNGKCTTKEWLRRPAVSRLTVVIFKWMLWWFYGHPDYPTSPSDVFDFLAGKLGLGWTETESEYVTCEICGSDPHRSVIAIRPKRFSASQSLLIARVTNQTDPTNRPDFELHRQSARRLSQIYTTHPSKPRRHFDGTLSPFGSYIIRFCFVAFTNFADFIAGYCLTPFPRSLYELLCKRIDPSRRFSVNPREPVIRPF